MKRRTSITISLICFSIYLVYGNENIVNVTKGFDNFTGKFLLAELPYFCTFGSDGNYLEAKDSSFYKIPSNLAPETDISQIIAVSRIPVKNSSVIVLLFSVNSETLELCSYTTNGNLIDRLVITQHYMRDNALITEELILRTIDIIPQETDKPVIIERRYQLEANGKIRFTEDINYIELAKPWVEETRKKRKERLDELYEKLSKATPEEANRLYDNVSVFFADIDIYTWHDCANSLNFSYDDEYEEFPDFWNSLKVDLFNYIESARYVDLSNEFYNKLFGKYVTADYREALKLYIVDDYTIEDSEELRVDMEMLPVYITDREAFAATYPSSKHTSALLYKCIEYIESFLFCKGINTGVFEYDTTKKIHKDALDIIIQSGQKYPGTKLNKIIRLFLDKLELSDYCYSDLLKEKVMLFAKKQYVQ